MTLPAGSLAATQSTFAATLVDEWVRAGVADAVVCPGSRSTPLVLALAGRRELGVHVRLDERSAGFFAIGLAVSTGRPVVVCTTSGTAAAELHPAVVEARHQGVALIVCTADRPPELQGVGAPQTIDQVRLYGNAVRWTAEPGVPDPAARHTWRDLAARSVLEATGAVGEARPGPVHLNLAFRDPLVGEPGPLPEGRSGDRPWVAAGPGGRVPGDGSAGPVDPGAVPVAAWAGRRGVVVAGAGCGPAGPLLALGARLGWPVVADPRSGCRSSGSPAVVVASADALLRDPSVCAALRPEVVLALGAPWASKAVAGWMAAATAGGGEVVAVERSGRPADPDRVVAIRWRADPAGWVADALGALDRAGIGPGEGMAPDRWASRWAVAEAAAQSAVDGVLAADLHARGGRLSEPGVARRLLGLVPSAATVVVSSSMPVRDLEWFAPLLPGRPPAVVANRGANGIDGVSSTALGVAAGTGGPVVALLGDLAFLHDTSALVGPRPATPDAPGPSCTLVVLDNAGGGIFSFLPQAAAADPVRFEMLFATPQAPDVVDVARGFGHRACSVSTPAELEAALAELVGTPGLSVVRVTVPDRPANVELHARLAAAAGGAAASALRSG